jgi:CheY-like chemotaxis protein
MRVLVVDDEPQIRTLVADVLAIEVEVWEAADGPTALAMLRGGDPFDCVLLDVMMPGMTGFQVLEVIRSDADLQHVAVVMLTAKAGENEHLTAFRDGADAYLTKPFDVDDVINAVKEVGFLPRGQRAQRRRSELERAELLARIETSFGR